MLILGHYGHNWYFHVFFIYGTLKQTQMFLDYVSIRLILRWFKVQFRTLLVCYKC